MYLDINYFKYGVYNKVYALEKAKKKDNRFPSEFRWK